jgi:hypothetical protein
VAIGGTAFDVEVLPDDRSFVGCLKAYAPAERGRGGAGELHRAMA